MNVNLDSSDTVDWTVTHGRSIALAVALMDSHERIMAPPNHGRVKKALLAFSAADRVSLIWILLFV